MNPPVWVHAATAGGAAALQLGALGSLAVGKRPGLIDVVTELTDSPYRSLVENEAPTVRWMASA